MVSNLSDSNLAIVLENGKTTEYYYQLQDDNTLTVTSKTSLMVNGENRIVEQTATYTRLSK